ncbi:arachidonate 5-lipoxygenase-activating protein isoform X4 [Ailuropoda melanoleuca]|uniref:arachidonate 5-lipoxygenase-activating protein isoform X4 n=1 Tax=Ailuropoda melanoleuca TaxID=9646 RepID=UPI001494A374|nr:arachidonate 5-lipoxygenase-activating protein isoform X4 [Ailuropoda melanoleuca]
MEQAKRFSFCHLPRAWARSVLTPGPPGQPPDCRSALWWRRHCVIWKGGLEVLQWCRVPARRRGQRRVVGRSCCPGGSPWCGRCSPALQTHASVPLDLWERRARRMRRRGSCGEPELCRRVPHFPCCALECGASLQPSTPGYIFGKRIILFLFLMSLAGIFNYYLILFFGSDFENYIKAVTTTISPLLLIP